VIRRRRRNPLRPTRANALKSLFPSWIRFEPGIQDRQCSVFAQSLGHQTIWPINKSAVIQRTSCIDSSADDSAETYEPRTVDYIQRAGQGKSRITHFGWLDTGSSSSDVVDWATHRDANFGMGSETSIQVRDRVDDRASHGEDAICDDTSSCQSQNETVLSKSPLSKKPRLNKNTHT
jgi:hypothetical protein